MGSRAEQKGLVLSIGMFPDLPALRMGDPSRLRQVLPNLVGNALKFTEQGSVTLTASAWGDKDAGDLIHFSVRDTGIGIAPGIKPVLFGRFTQADTSTARKFGGTGLGLAIVKHVVNRHRGALTIDSTIGEGSIFTVYLPAVSADGLPADTPHAE